MAVQNNANIGFEKQIWDAACVLWGHIPAAEYRKVIVGLIFLRYISSAFEKRYQQLVEEGDGFEDDKDAYAEDNIFFVPEDARWNKISSAAMQILDLRLVNILMKQWKLLKKKIQLLKMCFQRIMQVQIWINEY